MLDHLKANHDVWEGWTYWAAGPRWGDYRFTVEPTADGRDRPQMAVLQEHFVPEPSSVVVLAAGITCVAGAWIMRRRATAS